MSDAAKAYARSRHDVSSTRNRSAGSAEGRRQLQEVQTNGPVPARRTENALLFNRRLWSIFMSDALPTRIRSRSRFGRTSPISVCS